MSETLERMVDHMLRTELTAPFNRDSMRQLARASLGALLNPSDDLIEAIDPAFRRAGAEDDYQGRMALELAVSAILR